MGDGSVQEQDQVSLSSPSKSSDRAERRPYSVRARSELSAPQTRIRASLVRPRGRTLLRWHELRSRNIRVHARPALRGRDDHEERMYGCVSSISGSDYWCASALRRSDEPKETRIARGIRPQSLSGINHSASDERLHASGSPGEYKNFG